MVTSGGKSVILRLEMDSEQTRFSDLAQKIEELGGNIVGMDFAGSSGKNIVRDVTVRVEDAGHVDKMIAAIQLMPIRLIHVSDRTFLLHLGGKLSVTPKTPIQNRDDLSRVYT